MPPQAGWWPPSTVAKMKIKWLHFSWSVLFGLVVNSETLRKLKKAELNMASGVLWTVSSNLRSVFV